MSIEGKKIVLTGKLQGMSRKVAGDQLKALGAKVSSSPSSKTDMVFAGRAAGSKLYKAYDAGVTLLAEPHLRLLLEEEMPLDDVLALGQTFYTYDLGSDEPQTLSRFGGVPAGFGADRWPTFGGAPGRHLFTLDLEELPALAIYYPGKRTLSAFGRHDGEWLDMSDIYRPTNSSVRLITSTQEQVDVASEPPEGVTTTTTRSVEFTTRHTDDLGDCFGRSRLLGGVPLWCQYEEHQGLFLGQMGEESGISGDGLVYLFDDSVFAQIT